MSERIQPDPIDSGRFKSRLAAGETLAGTFAGLGSTVAVEVAARAGADWVLIDLEHGAGSEADAGAAILAAGAYGAAAVIRVETGDRIRVGHALDAGAAGIMFPRVADAAEATALVRHLRYPPNGDRGAAGYNRQGGYGLDPAAMSRADDRIVGIIQIEVAAAIENVREIAAVEGVDALFIGPVDLSYAVGTPRDFSSQPFVAAVDRILAAAQEAGIAAGILAADIDTAAEQVARGFRLLAYGSDASVLAASLRNGFDRLASASPTAS